MSNMSKHMKFIRNVFNVMIANVFSLVGSLASGFLLPKLFSVEDYGFFKIFTLYLTYTGMLHFGLCDGILLKYSGICYEELDKYRFRSITRFYAIFQLCLSIIIIGVSFYFQEQYHYIVFYLGICTFSINMITYFQFLSQASLRFAEFSKIKIITSLLTLIAIIGMYLTNTFTGYRNGVLFYLALYVIINWVILIYYIYKYKEIIFGERISYKCVKKDIISYFKTGIVLTFSYQILQLVLNLDRQFVSVLFTTSEYAIYSFAYSLISMITTVISSISLVLFPTIKQLKSQTAMSFFATGILGVESLVLMCLGGYYPLVCIINLFLPKYIDSLEYLRILFPGLVISSCITIIIFTYYKILEFNLQFFYIGVVTLGLSGVFNYVAWKIYGTTVAISWASIIVLIIWYILTIKYLQKRYNIKYVKNLIYVIIICVCFYFITTCSIHWVKGIVLYEAIFIGISILFNTKEYKKILNDFKKR